MFSRVSPYWFWVLLSLPGFAVLVSLINAPDSKAIHEALHPTGEFAARFMIIGMMASPLADLPRFYTWTGWIAFVIFVPLAVTSSDYFVRNLGETGRHCNARLMPLRF